MLNMLLVRAWEGNEEHDIEIGKKEDPYYLVIVPYGHMKTELISNELVYPAESVFKQSIEGVSCFLAAYIKKIQQERDKLRKELFSQTEPVLKIWKSVSLSWFQKMLRLGDLLPGKCALGNKAKGVAFASALKGSNLQSVKAHKGLFKEIRNMVQPSQQKPERDGIIQERSVEEPYV